MAKNDVTLLDGIIDRRIAEVLPSEERDEVFEFLAIEEALKDYDLDRDQLESGWIDGRDDGGIDGFYVFINGHILDDASNFLWPRSNAAIDLWLVTCKHHSTFRQAVLDTLLATIQELFDLSIPDSDLRGSYSEDLLTLRGLFASAYRKLSIGNPLFRFHVWYTSRGDTSELGESVVARSEQIKRLLSTLFSSCSIDFRFVGASELIQSHRRSKTFSLSLPFLEHLATGRNSYVLLVNLRDYWQFVTDESGGLRRYLFDSNVRDYMGEQGVNQDIAASLADEAAPDFWWLNNGVTILATNATVPGKTIQLQDIQIVNGLQTTETIFRHFASGSTLSRDRALLVKIIISSDPHARDLIIRATNNQTPVAVAALHATDKIQRDIEAILERNNWYYERRPNYYRNIGRPQSRLVTPAYLASAAVTLIMRNPRAGTRLRTKFMRSQSAYDSVFSPGFPIEVWPILVIIFKSIDTSLPLVAHPLRRGERFLRLWRPLVALLVVARRLGTFGYGPEALLDSKLSTPIESQEVEEAWEIIIHVQSGLDKTIRPRQPFVPICCQELANRHGILAWEAVGRFSPGSTIRGSDILKPVDEAFVALVNSKLPDQPWKPGIHFSVAQLLNTDPHRVQQAVQQLIASKVRYPQRDGIVYSHEGVVLTHDPSRLSSPPEESPCGEQDKDDS